jgi:hypothetical protein
MPDKDDIIASLLRELAAFQEAGDEENVAGVKAELARMGFKPAAPAKRAETRPAPETEKRGPGRPRKAAVDG